MHPPPTEKRPLTAREREVLDAIVAQYIHTGTPVSSRAISKSNSEQLSPATVRSIMADLEEAGYVTHPHTSAGRIPTDLGYRFYVDALDVRAGLTEPERRRIAEGLYATGGIDSLLARCCKLLSAASQQVGVGTAPDRGATVFRHVELVKLSEERLLVLLIASSGIVLQQVLAIHVAESQGELERYSNFLNAELAGRTLPEVRSRVAALMAEERSAYDSLTRRALAIAAEYLQAGLETREIYVDGTERLIERPDPADFDRMKGLLVALEDKRRMLRILDQCLAAEGGVVTAIGSENPDPELSGCSLVAASYGVGSEPMGMLAIIGPTRMEYDRAMALVSYVSSLLGSALGSSR